MYSNCVACGAPIPHESGSLVCRECSSRGKHIREPSAPFLYDIVICIDPTVINVDSARLMHDIMRKMFPNRSIAVSHIDPRYIGADYGRERIL